jgi:rare lipoprotein A
MTPITRRGFRYWTGTVLAVAFLFFAGASVASADQDRLRPPPRSVGTASWYGDGFDGRATASGEVFDQNALTAAHRSLPFGTRARVTNLANGRSVIVRINDRGPYVQGRLLDLSHEAAHELGMERRGTERVAIQILRISMRLPARHGILRSRRAGAGSLRRTTGA